MRGRGVAGLDLQDRHEDRARRALRGERIAGDVNQLVYGIRRELQPGGPALRVVAERPPPSVEVRGGLAGGPLRVTLTGGGVRRGGRPRERAAHLRGGLDPGLRQGQRRRRGHAAEQRQAFFFAERRVRLRRPEHGAAGGPHEPHLQALPVETTCLLAAQRQLPCGRGEQAGEIGRRAHDRPSGGGAGTIAWRACSRVTPRRRWLPRGTRRGRDCGTASANAWETRMS